MPNQSTNRCIPSQQCTVHSNGNDNDVYPKRMRSILYDFQYLCYDVVSTRQQLKLLRKGEQQQSGSTPVTCEGQTLIWLLSRRPIPRAKDWFLWRDCSKDSYFSSGMIPFDALAFSSLNRHDSHTSKTANKNYVGISSICLCVAMKVVKNMVVPSNF